jgi:hypothetical protein
MNNLLTIRETADALRQSPCSIRRKVKAGDLAAFRIGTGPRAPLRIAEAEIYRFLHGKTIIEQAPETSSPRTCPSFASLREGGRRSAAASQAGPRAKAAERSSRPGTTSSTTDQETSA